MSQAVFDPVRGVSASSYDGEEAVPTKALAKITDWYIQVSDPRSSFIYPGNAKVADHPLLLSTALKMRDIADEEWGRKGRVDFSAKVHGIHYRGHVIPAQRRGDLVAFRRSATAIPELGELGIHPALVNLMLHNYLQRGGLVLLSGETGQGKSTTCAAMLKSRMMKFGSFCMTIEDPIEMPLDGDHGIGHCIQTEVEEGGFASALRGAARSYPAMPGSILYLGEIRDSETAKEIIRIAINGHLVVSTIHSTDLMGAVQRLSLMADDEDTLLTLASVYRLGIHQRLDSVPDPANPGEFKKRLNIEFLASAGSSTPVGSKIRQGKAITLGTEIDNQKRLLDSRGADAIVALWQ